jgi:hypothetical protein
MNTSELDVTDGVWVAAVLTAVLAGLHLAAPWIRRLPMVPERYTGSFAGGLAVAYVFLDLLPEIAAGNETIGATLQDVIDPIPLVELVERSRTDTGTQLPCQAPVMALDVRCARILGVQVGSCLLVASSRASVARMKPRWLKAWGKFPASRLVAGSYSSA